MILIDYMSHILKNDIYQLFKSHVQKAYKKQHFLDFHDICLQLQMLGLYLRHVMVHQPVHAC